MLTDLLVGEYTEENRLFHVLPRAERFPAERELRGKQVQVLRGPATVTDEPISDTTESTACAEDFREGESGI